MHCAPPPRPVTIRPSAAAILVSAIALAACSGSDDGDSGVDRTAVDAAMIEIAEAYFADDTSPPNGVRIEDAECPVLGDRSIVDIVNDSDADIALSGDSSSGLIFQQGDGLSVECRSNDDNGASADIVVAQVPELDATEFVRRAEPFSVDDVSYTVERFDGFEPDVVATSAGGEVPALTWVDNSLSVSVRLRDQGDFVSTEDMVAVLSEAREAVLDTLQGSSDAEPVDAGDLGRTEIIDALDAVMTEVDTEDPAMRRDEPCPVLGAEQYASAADALGGDIDNSGDDGDDSDESDEDDATARTVHIEPRTFFINCTFGENPDVRTVGVVVERPVSVEEYAAFIDGPLSPIDATVMAFDVSSDGLGDDRTYVYEQDVGGRSFPTFGWIDNGLRIAVLPADGDDPDDLLTTVVPAVLDTLGLS